MPAKKKVANIVSIPAPIGGWNVRDPLPSMEPIYAPILDNCFCLPSEIQIRRGWEEWATFDGTCKTIVDYDAASGEELLIACVEDDAGVCSLYDVYTSGHKTVPLVTGLTSALFKHCHFATSGGFFSYYVNNADSAILYDGTTWHTVTTTSTPYAITNVPSTEFMDVVSHKRRLWFTLDNSLKAYYLPTDQIAGAAQPFDFAPIFSKGGHIVKIDTWSLDAGQGLDDYFVVFTTEGEVAVYTGTDPASASTWQLSGVFYIGTPTGTVGHTCKYGGDLLIINKDGLAQMSKSLMSSRVNTWLQLTDKIQPQLALDTSTYQFNEGWDLLLFPPANMLMVNVPLSDGTAYQYVMNTISGGWARWTDINANCWYYANEDLWFGSDGYVGKAWFGQNDNGQPITANILPAYQNFGIESQLKRWSLGRVILGTTGPAAYNAKIELDFDLAPKDVTLPIVVENPVAIYGTALYGSSVYGGNIDIKRKWQNLGGLGYWGSLHVQIKTTYSDIRFYSYDMMIEAGGNL